MLFLFGFHFIKILSRIIRKEGFVCVKIAAGNIFFCRTGFLMNGYRPTSSLFILFSFVQRTRQGKVFGRCLWLQKVVRCVHPLAEKFCIRWKAAVTYLSQNDSSAANKRAIYTRSTRFSAPCFRVYRQRIWKALIWKFYDFWNENHRLLNRFCSEFQAVDFKAG